MNYFHRRISEEFLRWNETWLNEGFADYLSHLASDELDSDSNAWARMLVAKDDVRIYIRQQPSPFCRQ
jgi:aminopeptidase N